MNQQRELLEKYIQQFKEQPETAKVASIVKATTKDNFVILESGKFAFLVDEPPPLGGGNKAVNPTQLFLGALAGCAGAFIKDTLAPLGGVSIDDVEVEVGCQADLRGLLGIGDVQPDYQNISLSITIHSKDSEDKIEQLFELYQKRCPIYLGIIKPMSIATNFQIKS